jgi:hypothetical protein
MEEILKRFDEKFNKPIRDDLVMFRDLDKNGQLFIDYSDIKAFLTTVIAERDKKLVSKLEEMKKKEIITIGNAGEFALMTPEGLIPCSKEDFEIKNPLSEDEESYNQALSDAISIIKDMK